MRQTIGLIAGGFKPLTAGHWSLIETASRECDQVRLVVSTKDRARPDELPILWSQMRPIWNTYIKKVLPTNVIPIFSPAPIKNIMDILIEANDDEDNHNTYVIYGDAHDTATNFPQRAKEKYMDRLIDNDQVEFRTQKRTILQGKTISGTFMRKYLTSGNLTGFANMLPAPLRKHANEIYKLLGGR